MKCLLIWITWLFSLSCATALVHFKKTEKGANGCLINGEEVAVGEYKQDNDTCGAYTCMNKEGDAFIHYCQIPVTFAECTETAVLTEMDFPQCCWACASWADCDAKEEEEGETTAEGETTEGDTTTEETTTEEEEAAGRRTFNKNRSKADKASLVWAETHSEALQASNRTRGSRPNQIFTAGTKKPGGPRGPELAENLKFGGRTPITKFGEEPSLNQPSEEVDIGGTKLYGAPKAPNEPQTEPLTF